VNRSPRIATTATAAAVTAITGRRQAGSPRSRSRDATSAITTTMRVTTAIRPSSDLGMIW